MIEAVMTTNVATCTPGESLAQVVERMRDYDCGALPVLDEAGHVTGMITDRDICLVAHTRGQPLAEIPVRVAMTFEAVAVNATDAVEDVARLMQDRRVRRLPVTDDGGKLVGIVSIDDLARASAYPPPYGEVSESLVARTLAAVCEPRERPPTATG